MSGGLNKVIFIFVGLFLTFLLVAIILGRFKFLGVKEPASTGSLGDALALKPAEEKKGIWESLFGSKDKTELSPTQIPEPTNVILPSPTQTQMIISPSPIPTIPVVYTEENSGNVAGADTKGGVDSDYYWNDPNRPKPVQMQYAPETIPATGSPAIMIFGSALSMFAGLIIKRKVS